MSTHPPTAPAAPGGELDAVALWAGSTCPACGRRGEVIPLTAGRWGVGSLHEPGCPEDDADDDSPSGPVISDDPTEMLDEQQVLDRLRGESPPDCR